MQNELEKLGIKKLGFGLMRLPRLENGAMDLEQIRQMTDLFLEHGFTYFDTAYVYDGGMSEQAARDALQAESDRLEQEKQAAREQARLQLQQAETQAEQERVEELRRAKESARAAEQKTREEMQAQIRQDGEVLAAAEPALAELLTRKLLEKGERT